MALLRERGGAQRERTEGLEKEEEFEDEVVEWREKTTANGHAEFVTFFQDRDRVV